MKQLESMLLSAIILLSSRFFLSLFWTLDLVFGTASFLVYELTIGPVFYPLDLDFGLSRRSQYLRQSSDG